MITSIATIGASNSGISTYAASITGLSTYAASTTGISTYASGSTTLPKGGEYSSTVIISISGIGREPRASGMEVASLISIT